MEIVAFEDVSKTYRMGEVEVTALNQVCSLSRATLWAWPPPISTNYFPIVTSCHP
jgi:hypothetical protein